MNKVYLLLPVEDAQRTNRELSYLKNLVDFSEQEVKDLVDSIVKTMKLNKSESAGWYFDQRKYLDLRSKAKALEKGAKPSLVDRMDASVKNFVDFRHRDGYDKNLVLQINYTDQSGTILTGFISDPDIPDSVAVNANALVRPIVGYTNIQCDDLALHEWFTKHRKPKRELDVNYKKHGDRSYLGKKGVVVSRLSYNKTQAEVFLDKAVGVRLDGETSPKNLFFHDKVKDLILVFWNENVMAKPTYHAYQISPDDLPEIQKIFKKGGRELVENIKRVAE